MDSPSVSLTAAELSFLLSVDSPTVANAVEPFQVRDRCDGFLGGSIRAQFPDLGVMVGLAVTVTMTSVPGPVPSSDGLWRMWEALERAPKPAVLVIQDVSGAPSRCAYIGEIMSTLAQRLGAVGAVTDGGVRDLAEVHALGFHYFAPYPVVSHGNFDVVDVGVPVTLDGQIVHPGDILHGDLNGIVLVPRDILSGLPAAVERIRTSERARLDRIKAPEFGLAGYRRETTSTY